MAKIYFFTKEDTIQTTQTESMAFGPQPNQSGLEIYNLDNKFSVTTDAPAYAITKSLVLTIQDSTNPQSVTIALCPINSYTIGFPIQFFIYRGIRKSSLIDGSGNIPLADSTWDTDNILKVIKGLQDRINSKNGTSFQANSDSLGYNFGVQPDTTFIEKIFYDDTDNFHPVIVEGGCQIGKFLGGATAAGMEIVMDRIGYEGRLSLLKANSHTLSVPQYTAAPGTPEQTLLTEKFNNRLKKEEILNYLDIAAFYGAAKNQKLTIKGANTNDDFLARFYNKNKVYIDIRDDRGFSYNHFLRFDDEIKIGFYSSDPNATDPVFNAVDYYSGWPLLVLSNQSFVTSKSFLFITVPVLTGKTSTSNFLSSYVGKISTLNDDTARKHLRITNNESISSGGKSMSEPVRLGNWKFTDNKLGSNYFLLKKATTGLGINQQEVSSIWNNFFSLKMNNIYGFDQLQEGEYRVNTYSSINSPLIVNSKKSEVYYPVTGIAVDKKHVTFFAFKDEMVFAEHDFAQFKPVPLVGKGKRIQGFDPLNYDYPIGTENVGFLNQINKSSKIQNFELQKFTIPDPDNSSTIIKVLNYAHSGNFADSDEVFQSFEAITLTHSEYNVLKAYQDSYTGTFAPHPVYISCKSLESKEYEDYTIEDYTLTIGEPTLVEDEDNNFYFIDIVNTPTTITYNTLPIILSSILLE